MKVLVIAMTDFGSPTRKRARSMMCAPRSPSAPLPASFLSSRQIMGKLGSMIHSCR